MHRRMIAAFGFALLMLLVLARPAAAGGWAVVTLDTLPTEVRAEQKLALGFVVRQHGKTPINVEAMGNGAPFLSARNAATGASFTAEARQEGLVGHYVLDVAFPSAGEWSWNITPGPFAPTDFGVITVLPIASSASTATNMWDARGLMQFAGATLLLAACVTAGITLLNRRGAQHPTPAPR